MYECHVNLLHSFFSPHEPEKNNEPTDTRAWSILMQMIFTSHHLSAHSFVVDSISFIFTSSPLPCVSLSVFFYFTSSTKVHFNIAYKDEKYLEFISHVSDWWKTNMRLMSLEINFNECVCVETHQFKISRDFSSVE